MSKRLEILTVDLRMQALQHDKQSQRSATAVRNYAKEAKKAETASAALSSGFGTAANQASVLYGPLNGVSGRLSAVASGLSSMGVIGFTAAAGIGAVTFGAAQALSVFSKWETQQLKTEALVRSTGSAAGFTAMQLEELARANALNTLGSVEDARSAINILQTFKTVQGDAFTNAIEISHDLAAVMGGDVKSAALQLGKALEDPTTGLTALKRSGVSFSETEKELIKDLQEHNRLSEAQALILDKVNSQVGGAGVAAAEGLTGAMDTLGQRYDEFLFDLAETSTLGYLATSAINGIAKSIDNWNKTLFPSDRGQLDQYVRDREEAQEKLNKIQNSGYASLVTAHQQTVLNKEIAGLNKQITVIQNRRITQQKDETAAREAAEKSELARKKEHDDAVLREKEKSAAKNKAREDGRIKKEQERAAAATVRKHQSQAKAGSDYLSQLDLQFADGQTKLAVQHQQRIEKINSAVITEGEAKARGFKTVAALREHYALQEDEFFQRRLDKELSLEEKRKARDQEKLQAEDSRKLEKVARFLEEEMSAEARELMAYERRQQMINDALKGREDSENTFRFASEKNWAKYQKNLTKLESDKTREQLQNSSELFDSLSGLAKGFAGEQSGIYKAMFIASKAFALADSIMKIQQGIANAASLPFPANLPAIGTVVSATAGIVSTIQGTKYHTGGIIGERPNLRANEVPIIGLRGEEVLTETDPRHRNNIGRKAGGGVLVNQTNHFYSDGSSNQEGNGEEYSGFLDRISDVVRKTIHEEQMPGGMLEAG